MTLEKTKKHITCLDNKVGGVSLRVKGLRTYLSGT